MQPGATLDSVVCNPSQFWLKNRTSYLNEKPAQVVVNVTSQSSIANNSVGPSLLFVGGNAPLKVPIGSTGVVDDTFGALTLINRVVPSNNEASGLNELQSFLASTLPWNTANNLQSFYVLPSSQFTWQNNIAFLRPLEGSDCFYWKRSSPEK